MKLDDFLRDQGFSKVELDKNSIGQLTFTIQYGQHPLRLILDTGASSSVIDILVAKRLSLSLEPLSILGGGVGTAQATVFQLPPQDLHLEGVTLNDKALFAMDIQHVNQALAARDAEPIDGVLGSDILNQHHAIIDCQQSCLYLLK